MSISEAMWTVFRRNGCIKERDIREDQKRSIRDDKKKLEQAKKRLADLDVIISRLYEDYVLGNLNQDRYRKMSADYEAEQERLKLEIGATEVGGQRKVHNTSTVKS